ncbi:MAG: hypothetical protein Q7S69_01225 [Nitrosomonadaceae bacterium]|nr:hypothetical protein [Nitrosomonadaceae bacterium]
MYKLGEAALQDATVKYAAGKAFEIAVGEAVDGKFNIRIDIGHLNAYLTCTPRACCLRLKATSRLYQASAYSG